MVPLYGLLCYGIGIFVVVLVFTLIGGNDNSSESSNG